MSETVATSVISTYLYVQYNLTNTTRIFESHRTFVISVIYHHSSVETNKTPLVIDDERNALGTRSGIRTARAENHMN